MTEPVKIPKLHARWYEAHSIAGVFGLIPLFIIMVTGTITFYQHELIAWHIPAARVEAGEPVVKLDRLTADFIHEVPKEAKSLFIEFPNRYFPILTAKWPSQDGDREIVRAVNPQTAEAIDSNTVSSELAHHLYLWHFLFPLPQGIILAGFLSLAWIALTVSGIYIHRKKLISQFTEGWKHASDRAWQSWLHSIIGTLTLPFHLIYGITGVLYGLGTLALPLVLFITFGGDQKTMMENLTGNEEPAEVTGITVERLPQLDPFLERTFAQAPGAEIYNIFIENPYDEGALMHIHFTNSEGDDGEAKFEINRSLEPIFFENTLSLTPAVKILMPAFILHFGAFGGIPVKIAYTVMGITLCLLTYAGTRLWIYRKQRQSPRWSVVLDRLFDGFGLGLLPAIGIYAWANRLLPAYVADRGHVEILIFHWSWIAIGLGVLIAGTGPSLRRWMMHLFVGMLAIVPIFDGFLHDTWPWQANSWYVPSVGIINIILLIFGGLWFGICLMRRPSAAKSKIVEAAENKTALDAV
ncbi:MAG: PepSY-associated TM helix domain-containing protein [Verrucomicrobiota bacterium]